MKAGQTNVDGETDEQTAKAKPYVFSERGDLKETLKIAMSSLLIIPYSRQT